MSDLLKATRERDNAFLFGIGALTSVQVMILCAALATLYDDDTKSNTAQDTYDICESTNTHSHSEKSIKNTLNRLSQGKDFEAGETYYSTVKLSNGKKVTMGCVSYKIK